MIIRIPPTDTGCLIYVSGKAHEIAEYLREQKDKHSCKKLIQEGSAHAKENR